MPKEPKTPLPMKNRSNTVFGAALANNTDGKSATTTLIGDMNKQEVVSTMNHQMMSRAEQRLA